MTRPSPPPAESGQFEPTSLQNVSAQDLSGESVTDGEMIPQKPKPIKNGYLTDQDSSNQIKIQTTVLPTAKNPLVHSIHRKFRHSFQQSRKHKRCCLCCLCLYCRLVSVELVSNNQIYNLIFNMSPLTPRVLRLALLYLGLVLQLSACALFFNLYPNPDEQEPPFFWQGFLANFWVALYSVLFTIFPMLIVGLSLMPPARWRRTLRETKKVEEFQLQLARLKRKIKWRLIVGLVLFVFISCFCCLYLIGFSQVASASMSAEWLQSSLISILIDMFLFELIPAVSVAFFGLLMLGCRIRIMICLIVTIEGYRFIRNFVDT